MTNVNQQRPNILLITTDQQRADHLGVKGLKAVQTPHLDRLATEGVHFDRAYCPSPICTPSRVSLLTGKWPSNHGAYSIGVTVDPFPEPTVAQLLKQAGYSTSLIGKAHFVRRAEEAAHFTGQSDPPPDFFQNYHGPYLGFDTVYTCIGHTTNCMPDMHYRVFLEDAGVEYDQWFPRTQYSPWSPNTIKNKPHKPGVWTIPEELQNSAWIASKANEWIREQSESRPWFSWVSFEDPHPPFVCPEPWFSSVMTERMELYENKRKEEFADKPEIYNQIYRNDLQMYEEGAIVPCVYGRYFDEEVARLSLQATLGMISNIDAKVGTILRTLEEINQLENTIIIYTSDHGEMHGHHGFWGKGLTAYEDCQRVPLLIWGPAFFSKKGTTSALANLVDVTRTILSLANVDSPTGIQGTDLMPVLRKESNAVQDSTIVECQATRKIYQQTFITDQYKLVIYRDHDEGELYNLLCDPDQYENLWDHQSYRELKLELLHRFVQKQMHREGLTSPRVAFA